MAIGDKTVLACNCEDTIPLDAAALARSLGAGELAVACRLCTAELDRFVGAIAGERAVVVSCTQERTRFEQVRQARGSSTSVNYVNIRERAGWSTEAAAAGPKIAALLAEGALDAPVELSLPLQSQGRTLVYGSDARALAAAQRLWPRLEPIVLLTKPGAVLPPAAMDFPILAGTVVRAEGHLGAFRIEVDGHAVARPSGRRMLVFGPAHDGERLAVDLILDLSGGMPLFPAPERRNGYFRIDPNDPVAVEQALAGLIQRLGPLEHPHYLNFRADRCVHWRLQHAGCGRCIDNCPAGAIYSVGDTVAFDPFICAGCGICAAICPTGAFTYARPPPEVLQQRLGTLLAAYREAGGEAAVLLVHDQDRGSPLIDLLARRGSGLPARVIPFAVTPVTQLGADFFLAAFAAGAAMVRVLVAEPSGDALEPLHEQLTLTDAILQGLGYGSQRVATIETGAAAALEECLAALISVPAPAPNGSPPPADAEKQERLRAAVTHLHAVAPAPVDVLDLPERAPIGGLEIRAENCSLCHDCVVICPTGALYGAFEPPSLHYKESACVQCGLCRSVCPRATITLRPRLDFRPAAARFHLVVPEAAAEGQ